MQYERPDVASIGEKYIDIEKILAAKRVRIPRWTVRMLERLLHVPDLNQGIYLNREYFGLDFVHKFLEGSDPQDLNITIKSVGESQIPTDGNPMIVGNHPLGGPDGLALMGAVGRVRQDIKFPVNDFLLYLPGLRELFFPIDKVNRRRLSRHRARCSTSPPASVRGCRKARYATWNGRPRSSRKLYDTSAT